jgi:M6 family metalloprotease-like protein
MKNIARIFALAIIIVFTTPLLAVAPLPELGLKEPIYPRAPFTLAGHSAKRMAQREVNEPLAERGLLIVVEFADQSLAQGNTIHSFDSLFNGIDYTYNGAVGSCKKYFEAQSNGLYSPHFDVVGPVVLSQEMAYYGKNDATGNDQYVVDFVVEACRGAKERGVDFSQYDADNNGMVDFVYIIYAGYAESEGAPAYVMFPHNWDLVSALYYGYSNMDEYYANSDTDFNLPTFDGKMINVYACSNEIKMYTNARTGIGTICHEFSHILGLPDYYLTTKNPIVNERYTPGAWSLMGYGNYLNNGNTPPNYSVYDKYYLGWLEPTVLDHSQSLTIPADGVTTYMLTRNEQHVSAGACRTDTVYYIENRQQEGWDTYLPGHGLLIWRVIYDEEDWFYNCPNDFVARYQLISAEKRSSPYTTSKPKPEVPFPGKSKVTQYAPFTHNGLYNIQEADGLIICDFTTTNNPSSLNNPIAPDNHHVWYNLLGQPVDIEHYHGIVIRQGEKCLR